MEKFRGFKPRARSKLNLIFHRRTSYCARVYLQYIRIILLKIRSSAEKESDRRKLNGGLSSLQYTYNIYLYTRIRVCVYVCVYSKYYVGAAPTPNLCV